MCRYVNVGCKCFDCEASRATPLQRALRAVKAKDVVKATYAHNNGTTLTVQGEVTRESNGQLRIQITPYQHFVVLESTGLAPSIMKSLEIVIPYVQPEPTGDVVLYVPKLSDGRPMAFVHGLGGWVGSAYSNPDTWEFLIKTYPDLKILPIQ